MIGLLVLLVIMVALLVLKIIFGIGIATIDLLLTGAKGIVCVGLIICIVIVGILLVL